MPAPGWKKKTKSPSGVGLTLVNIRKAAHKSYKDAEDKAQKEVLESVLEVRDLDDVMEQAELGGRLFAVNNPLPDLLISSEMSEDNLTPAQKREQRHIEETLHRASLTVPRRPKWNPGMTPEELDVEERKAFLIWRRGLARLEDNEKLVITPFEKNLDIWRQLWRVLERSDLVVLVVDSRNPLFYRCPDLEAYVRELDQNKKVLLLLNKADLLTASSRQEWATYLKSQGVLFLFWSAKVATAILEGKVETSAQDHTSDKHGDMKDSDETHVLGRDELLHRLQKEAEAIAELQTEASRVALSDLVRGDSLSGSEGPVSQEGQEASKGGAKLVSSRRVVAGFVGYPNVGKSSTINALVGEKKTGVTSTPGKTKHFQTLIINEKLMLCDCPGLVFPSFTSSKSEMVASGVLPIDKLTDHRGPVQVVADNVPRAALETLYGVSLPKPKLYEAQNRPPTAAELLFVFAISRGYFANGGMPDETRAARLILKDYLSGKLPYCHLPPSESTDSGPSVSNNPQTSGVFSDEEDDDTSGSDGEDVDETSKGGEVITSPLSRNSLEDKEEIQLETTPSVKDSLSPEAVTQLLGVVNISADNLPQVFHDLDSSIGGNLRVNDAKAEKAGGALHKKHKKTARRKDRTWRAGGKQSVAPPVVSGVKIPVSHGAADRYQVRIFE